MDEVILFCYIVRAINYPCGYISVRGRKLLKLFRKARREIRPDCNQHCLCVLMSIIVSQLRWSIYCHIINEAQEGFSSLLRLYVMSTLVVIISSMPLYRELTFITTTKQCSTIVVLAKKNYFFCIEDCLKHKAIPERF